MKRFTQEEIEFIKNNKDILNNVEIANKLGRSYGSIAHVLNNYCIKRKESQRKLNSEEIDFIKNNKETMGNKEIGEKLGRTKNSISRYMNLNGIRRNESCP